MYVFNARPIKSSEYFTDPSTDAEQFQHTPSTRPSKRNHTRSLRLQVEGFNVTPDTRSSESHLLLCGHVVLRPVSTSRPTRGRAKSAYCSGSGCWGGSFNVTPDTGSSERAPKTDSRWS